MPLKQKTGKLPSLYRDLAPWFHLLTAPEDYKEEAEFYIRVLKETSLIPVKNILEMGSGGGNNAFHMKSRFKMTLTDISQYIMKVSKKINPECEHLLGDMRSLRLRRQFDAVFVQDAIDYMITETDLFKTFRTAFIHCKAGGAALFCPDYVRETFSESTETGGHDDGERGLRYMDWAWDPDKNGKSFISHFIIIMREGNKVEYRTDEHNCGLFPKQIWLDLVTKAGFKDVKAVQYPDSLTEKCITPVFTGTKPQK
jgi:hypothetical protein